MEINQPNLHLVTLPSETEFRGAPRFQSRHVHVTNKGSRGQHHIARQHLFSLCGVFVAHRSQLQIVVTVTGRQGYHQDADEEAEWRKFVDKWIHRLYFLWLEK